MRRMKGLAVLVLALALVATACGGGDTGGLCQVTDTGGIDDRSFNQTAWEGLKEAAEDFDYRSAVLESKEDTDYEPHINSFLDQECDLIVTVGFFLGDATKTAAEANSNVNFAIVDFAYDPTIPNVLGLVYNTDEAAFLAGYAAAGMSQTGKVGTFGGANIPTVTIFMDGFWYGVDYHNQQKGTNVEVVGWDPATQEGLFTGDFDNLDLGRQTTQTLLDEGVDIVMPVAGPVGLATGALADELETFTVIGVDADWYESASQYKEHVLTSVQKKMDASVYEAAKRVNEGTFSGGVFVGTLENGGVDLAPFHDYDADVPQSLKDELAQIRSAIIAGTLSVSG